MNGHGGGIDPDAGAARLASVLAAAARPSDRSMQARADRLPAMIRPHRVRGSGRSSRSMHSRAAEVRGLARAARAQPGEPGGGGADGSRHVEPISRPAAASREHAPSRAGADRRDVDDERSGRSREVAAGERRAVRRGRAAPRRRSARRNRRAATRREGPGSAGRSRGVAPIAARSLRLTATALWPIACGAVQRAAEVHVFDQAVGGDDFDRAAHRLDHRGVVADADGHPRRRGADAPGDPGDEVGLSE